MLDHHYLLRDDMEGFILKYFSSEIYSKHYNIRVTLDLDSRTIKCGVILTE